MQVVVDRIEGKMAVLEAEGGFQIEIPVKFLPAGVKDGTVLTVTFKPDPLSEKERRDKARDLQDRLKNRK